MGRNAVGGSCKGVAFDNGFQLYFSARVFPNIAKVFRLPTHHVKRTPRRVSPISYVNIRCFEVLKNEQIGYLSRSCSVSTYFTVSILSDGQLKPNIPYTDTPM